MSLILGDSFRSEDGPKTPFLILIVQQHNWSHAQRFPAVPAGGHFTLNILHKPIREVVAGALAARWLGPALPAMRADEFHLVLLRVTVERGPAGIADAYRFWV
jgi:hypothetical protein